MKEVLKKQRTRQRSKRLRLVGYVVVVGVMLVALYRIVEQRPPRNWQVEVLSLDAQEVPDMLRAEIIKTAQETLATGSRLHLQDAVDTLQENYHFAAVNLIQTDNDSVVIYVEVRHPRLRVRVGEDYRLISSKGEVYGYWDTQALPELIGVLAPQQRYKTTARGSLKLNQQEQQNIATALSVLRLAQDYELTSITWENYRGFKLKTKSMSVFLGLAPYEKKFAKLKTITSAAQKKGTDLTKIELDYHGKAFVKKARQ
ncbi:MAG: hypothetical protein OYH77_02010 [Pseudomonadota bacterium]|nr:hypothetical protein [Pseudomonadota bacterium]